MALLITMERNLVFVFLVVFLLKHKVIYASMCHNERYSEVNVYLQGFTFESSKVDVIIDCFKKCKKNIICASINMKLTDKTCELKYSTKTRHPENIVNQTNTIYMELRDALGSTPHSPIPSCKWFNNLDKKINSGVYWMKFNEPSSVPIKVFCDMTTDGGGWTLVYSYTFTQYNDLGASSSAIKPIPNWPVNRSSGKWVPQSTETPLSESSRTAMDFALWKKIGNEILLKPNITSWVVCVQGSGSLVNWVAGSVTCRVVKAITPNCITVTPDAFKLSKCGPSFNRKQDRYIYLDGKTDKCNTFHDPCGTSSSAKHLTNVPNPGGAIYIR